MRPITVDCVEHICAAVRVFAHCRWGRISHEVFCACCVSLTPPLLKVSKFIRREPIEYVRRKAWTATPVGFGNGIAAVTSLCLCDEASAGGEMKTTRLQHANGDNRQVTVDGLRTPLSTSNNTPTPGSVPGPRWSPKALSVLVPTASPVLKLPLHVE